MNFIGLNQYHHFGQEINDKQLAECQWNEDIAEQITFGENHALYLINNVVYVGGKNNKGQCGISDSDDRDINIKILPFKHQIKTIFTNHRSSHSFIQTITDEIYSFGVNKHGQLGFIDKKHKNAFVNVPTKLDIAFDVKCIETAENYSLALSTKGEVYATRFSRYGGNGFKKKKQIPWTKVKLKDIIAQIAVGFAHSLFINIEGKLLSCGNNEAGQLGIGIKDTDPHPNPMIIELNVIVIHIAAGSDFSLCATENGDVYSCGGNIGGQCGHKQELVEILKPTKIERLKRIEIVKAGHSHSAVIRRKPRVEIYIFGSNQNGECIVTADEYRIFKPTPISNVVKKPLKDIYLGYLCTCLITEETSYSEIETDIYLDFEEKNSDSDSDAKQTLIDELKAQNRKLREKFHQIKQVKEEEIMRLNHELKSKTDEMNVNINDLEMEIASLKRMRTEGENVHNLEMQRMKNEIHKRDQMIKVRQKHQKTEWKRKCDEEIERNQMKKEEKKKLSEVEQKTNEQITEIEKKLQDIIKQQEMQIEYQEKMIQMSVKTQTVLEQQLEDQKQKLKDIEEHQHKLQKEEKDKKQKEEQRIHGMIESRKKKHKEMEDLNRCNPSKYEHWSTNDLLQWIMGLDNGIYVQYKKYIESALRDNKINGRWLLKNNINCEIFKEWGIISETHCFKLFDHICSAEIQHKTRVLKGIKKKSSSNINKVLVICIGIAYYNADYADLDSNDDDKEDDGVPNDMLQYRRVFGDEYGYTVFPDPDDVRYAMTDEELNTFLIECRERVCSKSDRTKLFYDAVILTFGGHGNQHGIVCSNGRTMSWTDIRSIFSDKVICNIPRIFLIDTCRTYDPNAKSYKSISSGNNVLTTTIMASSEGKEVRGGMISKWITNAFKDNMNKNKTFADICDIAKDNIKGESGQILTFTEDTKECDRIIFKPNDKTRGRDPEKSEHTRG